MLATSEFKVDYAHKHVASATTASSAVVVVVGSDTTCQSVVHVRTDSDY